MAYAYFYMSVGAVWVFFAISIHYRPLRLNNIIIGISSALYSVIFDTIFGQRMGLYYYIAPQDSTLYTILSAVLVYSLLNIAYTLFLPRKGSGVLAYTALWMGAMLLFEYFSLVTGIVVFSGWKPIPWSFVTYVVSYGWMYYFFKFLSKRELCTE